MFLAYSKKKLSRFIGRLFFILDQAKGVRG